jgi:hypothetical protein
MNWKSRLVLCVIAATAFGCGGKGGLGPDQPSLRLTSSAQTVPYGQTVTVNWSSRSISSIGTTSTNFMVGSNQLNGSLIDRPASDTTYRIAGTGTDGRRYDSTVTVRVAPSTRRFVVVADQSLAGMPQMTEYIQALTTTPVQKSAGIPASITADVLVLFPSGAFGQAEQERVNAYLASGGKVLLLEKAPVRLATGSLGGMDTSAIGTWFAGATGLIRQNATNPGGSEVVAQSPGLPLSATLYGVNVGDVYHAQPVSANATLLTRLDGGHTAAFVYSPPSGGMVGYVGGFGVGASERDGALNRVLFAVLRHLAGG